MTRSTFFFWLTIIFFIALVIYVKGFKETIHTADQKAWGQEVQQTVDGGYIIVGVKWRTVGGCSDFYLIKTDALGRKAWDKTFGQGDADWGYALQNTNEGGYILVGTTWSTPHQNDSNVLAIKTDSAGKKLWLKSYGGNGDDKGRSVCKTKDGGYVICGSTATSVKGNDDILLIKIDGDGRKIWQNTWGGRGKDQGFSVIQAKDGGYIVVGLTDSIGQGREDVYLTKTDSYGEIVWSKAFGGKGHDRGMSVRQSTDGGYILAGTTWPSKEKYSDIYIIKTDRSGKKLWDKIFGDRYSDQGYAVEQTLDGGYIVAGNTWPSGSLGMSKIYVVKTDREGNKVWDKTLGGKGFQFGRSLCRAFDKRVVITGKTGYEGNNADKIFLAGINEDGTEAWFNILEN